jgi:hypothetical protein
MMASNDTAASPADRTIASPNAGGYDGPWQLAMRQWKNRRYNPVTPLSFGDADRIFSKMF